MNTIASLYVETSVLYGFPEVTVRILLDNAILLHPNLDWHDELGEEEANRYRQLLILNLERLNGRHPVEGLGTPSKIEEEIRTAAVKN